jgi:hypothetical protein
LKGLIRRIRRTHLARMHRRFPLRPLHFAHRLRYLVNRLTFATYENRWALRLNRDRIISD